MTTAGESGRVPAGTPEQLERVRRVFDSAGYNDESIARLLRDDLPVRLGPARIPGLLRRTGGGSRLDLMVRLFVLGVALSEEEVKRAVTPMEPGEWESLGLLERVDAGLRGTVQIRCFRELRVASDFGPNELRGSRRADYVMEISPSTLALAGLTVRTAVAATLDIGCGAGFQAFMAASHSDHVVAVDLNPRAVALARFNAALNGLNNVEILEGNLLEPVAGRRFGLIVSNPPFVIAPELGFHFLHSGLPGDEVCRRIVTQAGDLLEEAGFCQLSANWVVAPGDHWTRPIREWVQGTGCDALVLCSKVDSAALYAADWTQTATEDPHIVMARVEDTLRFFEAHRIESVASGFIVLRKRSGPNRFKAADMPESMAFPCGEDVLRMFEVLDALAAYKDDRELLSCRPRVGPDVILAHESRLEQGSWSPEHRQLQRTDGLGWRGSIDSYGARLLAACDGTRTLDELLDEMARSADLDRDTVINQSLPIIKRLLEQGFLVAEL